MRCAPTAGRTIEIFLNSTKPTSDVVPVVVPVKCAVTEEQTNTRVTFESEYTSYRSEAPNLLPPPSRTSILKPLIGTRAAVDKSSQSSR